MFQININKLKLLPRVGNREFVGIDFSSDSLKIAHVINYPNKKEVVNLISRDISGLSDEDLIKTIRGSFDELKTVNPNVIIIVPSHLIITKNIEIPSTDPVEIREIINLQASRHTPYSREEIIVDHIDIGSFKNSYTRILLIIVTRSIIKRYFEILSRAGFKSESVLLAPEGLSWLISKIVKLEKEDLPVNIVHIDEVSTDFIVVLKNKMLFIRNIPIGAKLLLTKEQRYNTRFIEELKRSFEAYQNENIEKNPSKVVLTGATEELGDLNTSMKKVLNMEIAAVPYFENLAISAKAMQMVHTVRDSSFIPVIAPLLAGGEAKINLIPEEIKLTRSIKEKGRDLIRTGIYVLAIFILTFFVLLSKIYFKDIYLKKIDDKYHFVNKEVGHLEREFMKTSIVKNYISNRGYSLEILREIYDIIPLDVALTYVRFDKGLNLSLRGTAGAMSSVFSFVSNMENSKYFKEVKTRHTTKRKDGLMDVTDFEITCLITKEGDTDISD